MRERDSAREGGRGRPRERERREPTKGGMCIYPCVPERLCEREGETTQEGGRDHTRGRERPQEGETTGTMRRAKSGGNCFKLQLNKARMHREKPPLLSGENLYLLALISMRRALAIFVIPPSKLSLICTKFE